MRGIDALAFRSASGKLETSFLIPPPNAAAVTAMSRSGSLKST